MTASFSAKTMSERERRMVAENLVAKCSINFLPNSLFLTEESNPYSKMVSYFSIV